jgi:hypothetical protein
VPVTTMEQASIALSADQVHAIQAIVADHPGARQGVTIEETNLGPTVAVKTIPGKRVHLVAWNGSGHQLGMPE